MLVPIPEEVLGGAIRPSVFNVEDEKHRHPDILRNLVRCRFHKT